MAGLGERRETAGLATAGRPAFLQLRPGRRGGAERLERGEQFRPEPLQRLGPVVSVVDGGGVPLRELHRGGVSGRQDERGDCRGDGWLEQLARVPEHAATLTVY